MNNDDLIAAITNSKGALAPSDKSALEFVLGENEGFQNTLDKDKADKRAKALRDAKNEAAKNKRDAAKALRDSLSSDQFLLTDMTDGKLPTSGINHILFRYPKGTWEEDHEANIPEANPFFSWDADVLEATWLGYIMNEKVLLVGPPGTGKTTIGQQLAAWIKQPFARFNGKDGIEPATILGYPWATKEGMEWRDGLLTQAVANGYLTIVDEIFKIPPGIQMAMQSLYEKDGFLMLDEKPGTIAEKYIHPRKEFRLIGTDNTKGTGDDLDKYGAGQMQDTSSLDRFGITVDVGYLTKRVEIMMLTKRHPTVDKGAIKRAVTMANLVRNAFINNSDLSLTMSPRGLSVVCGLLENNMSLAKSLELAYVNKLGDDTEIRMAKGLIKDAI